MWGGGAMAPAGDREGYWGPTTSTLDWCEENYAVTLFIAEFCEWGLRRGARARAEGRRRRVENAEEGEPGREGRLQAGPGSGSRPCVAGGSRGADEAARCAGAGFRGPSGRGRKGRASRAWTSEQRVRQARGWEREFLPEPLRPGRALPVPRSGLRRSLSRGPRSASPTAATRLS